MPNLDWKAVTALIVGAVVVYSIIKKDALAAAQAVGGAINPVSNQNVFYKATNAVGGAVTGTQSFSLGSWIYDKINPSK